MKAHKGQIGQKDTIFLLYHSLMWARLKVCHTQKQSVHILYSVNSNLVLGHTIRRSINISLLRVENSSVFI